MVTICVIIITAVLIALLFYFTIQHDVSKKSKVLSDLRKLNKSVIYDKNLQIKHQIYHQCKSKQSYDRLDMFDCLCSYIEADLDFYSAPLGIAKSNYATYSKYLKDYRKIMDDYIKEKEQFNLSFNEKITLHFEKKLYEKERKDKPESFMVVINKIYTSPKGQNHYSTKIIFDYQAIQKGVDAVLKARKYKQSKKYQRNLMSDSLRYDVMKRDNFTCVLCGATKADGAKLHVDHIIPVAKGGKTEMNNLRTLCDRCNSGKSDKYDAAGMN